ncbi:MAG: PEGA domain-containing protein [Acidobacteria bacterium]|nr:PEGA domain-containing protein [Acidobacteriota bacterium]
MLLSSGDKEPRGRSRVGLVIVAVTALVVVGAASWYFTREAPKPPTSPARPAPRAPSPTPRPAAPAPVSTGNIEVSASAPGSAVFVDGRRIGAAPQLVELTAGVHRVRVEKEGFRAFEKEVRIVPGRTLELEAQLEREVEGPRLRVETDVPGAQVFLDREFQGEAPVTVRDVALGEHRLNVSVEGYEMHAETIDVVPGTNEFIVRFKEVRLDEAIAVKHKHGVGSCQGRLVATIEGLRYETDHEKDRFSAPFSALEPLEVDYLKKNLRVQIRGGRKYNFTADDPDDLLTFQQKVEAARDRLQ